MKVIAALFVLLAVIASGIVAIVWSGYAMSILWGWFVVPAFSVAHLSTLEASGLLLVVPLATGEYRGTVKSENKWERWAFAFFFPLFSLAFGWVIKSWM